MKMRKILFYVYVLLLVGAIGGGLVSAFINRDEGRNLIDYMHNWSTSTGERCSLNELPTIEKGEKLVLTRIIPNTSRADDVWNLVSHNIYFTVMINDTVSYRYYPNENLTGKGYGDEIHHLLVKPVGGQIKLICDPIFPGEKGGSFKESCIGTTDDFGSYMFGRYGLSFALSMIIIIFGLLILVIHICSLGVAETGYNMSALGIGVLLAGGWTATTTAIPHLFLDDAMFLRILDYGALVFVAYPIVLFVNSVTEKKRKIYDIISFVVTIGCAGLMGGIRMIFKVDMHYINFFNLISTGVGLTLILIMIIDDAIDHRKNKRRTVNRALYIGALAFVVGATVELSTYYSNGKAYLTKGFCLMGGFLIFILLMIIQAMRRMLKEHQMVDQQRFVNSLLSYSFAGQSPDATIKEMLKYLGEETGADRAYVFEDRLDGMFDNTYEWCADGVTPQIDNLKGLEYEGLIEEWYAEYRKSGSVVISNLEEYKTIHPAMYDILKPQGIATLVTCPIEKENGYIGFFGLDNPPKDRIKDITPIIHLLAFFIVVALRQRDVQAELVRYSYVDHMTGVRNRRALELIREQLDGGDKPYGMMMCDINGLKKANDEEGHEAGDAMICDVANALKDIFGDRRVFRMGGDEFLVVREGGVRGQFVRAIDEAKRLIDEKKRSVSFGISFTDESDDFEELLKLADTRMYEEKKNYYETVGDRRRGNR